MYRVIKMKYCNMAVQPHMHATLKRIKENTEVKVAYVRRKDPKIVFVYYIALLKDFRRERVTAAPL